MQARKLKTRSTMTPDYFIHPDDAYALRQLQQIPILPKVVDWYMKNGIEELSWIRNTSYCIRLSETQFPEIYKLLPPICSKFGIAVPELYLDMDVIPNAWTSGSNRVYITVTRGLVKRFRTEEIQAVLAHECGHIVCQHTFYQAIADGMIGIASISENDGIVGGLVSSIGSVAMVPLRRACLAWQRKSELSADRAASVICGEETFTRTMAMLSQIPRPMINRMNLKQWANQGKELSEYQNSGVVKKALTMMSGINDSTHPAEVIRAYEFSKWINSPEYKRMLSIIENSSGPVLALPAESETKRRLREVKEMYQSGLIDQAEYERERKRILNVS